MRSALVNNGSGTEINIYCLRMSLEEICGLNKRYINVSYA